MSIEVLRISWMEAVKLCYKLAEAVASSGYEPEVVVAVLRGGAVPALIISDYLGVEDFYAVRVKHWGIAARKYAEPVVIQAPPRSAVEGRKVLVVDEVVDTGLTLMKVIKELEKDKPACIRSAVLHVKPSSKLIPDYYAEKLSTWKWIFYPWSVVETLTSLASQEEGGASTKEALVCKVKDLIAKLKVSDVDEEAVLRGVEIVAEKLLKPKPS